jgi:hypothetical protein
LPYLPYEIPSTASGFESRDRSWKPSTVRPSAFPADATQAVGGRAGLHHLTTEYARSNSPTLPASRRRTCLHRVAGWGAHRSYWCNPQGRARRPALAGLPWAWSTQVSACWCSCIAGSSRQQAAARFREFGIDFGYVLAGEPVKRYARAQIASRADASQAHSPPRRPRHLRRGAPVNRADVANDPQMPTPRRAILGTSLPRLGA